MSGTSAGNRKVAAKIKAKYGVDEQGRSKWHAQIGSVGGENSHGGYFKTLKEIDPELLEMIARKGGENSAAKRTSPQD